MHDTLVDGEQIDLRTLKDNGVGMHNSRLTPVAEIDTLAVQNCSRNDTENIIRHAVFDERLAALLDSDPL